jgi:hypothetical protein
MTAFKGPVIDHLEPPGIVPPRFPARGRASDQVREGTASLDQARSRSAYRFKHGEPIELGNEPPLSVRWRQCRLVDPPRVSVQMVCRHNPDCLSALALMGRRRFHIARRRN